MKIITVLDGITETSMPFNEFVLYRASHFPEEKHTLIVCNIPQPLPKVVIPSSLEIIYAGKNFVTIRQIVKKEIKKCKDNNEYYLFHLHQVSSALRIELAMLGTGFRKKVLFTVHNTFTGYPFHNKVRSYMNGLLARYVTCVSNTAYEGYPSSLKRLKGKRVIPIQNGVDTERMDKLLTSNPRKDGTLVTFAYVARMASIKNHVYLLDVAKEIKDNVRFLFIGAKEPRIMKQIKEEHLDDKIITTGLIPRQEVFERLQSSDYYISSSTLEGLPVSLLEGMYAGLPSVISDIPQHKEVCNDCEFYKLLPFNKSLWISTINQLAELPLDKRKELGEKAKRYIYNNFSLKSMHEKYTEIYQKLSKE